MAISKAKQRKQLRRPKRLPKGPHGGVELLLIQSVEDLGQQGEVVEVKPGFAYNYLLPQGLATVATEHHKRMVEKHQAKLAEAEQTRLKSIKDLAARLGKQSVTIEAKANDEGHLYGSVGPPEITAALKKFEFDVDPDRVRLEGPLKELGLYTVTVNLHKDIDAELKVWVVPLVEADKADAEKT